MDDVGDLLKIAGDLNEIHINMFVGSVLRSKHHIELCMEASGTGSGALVCCQPNQRWFLGHTTDVLVLSW